jgi:hypothetical protein
MPIPLRKNRSLHLTGTDFFESRTAGEYRLVLDNEETIMFYALSWFAVFSLLTLWSLAAWAFHSIVAWTISNAGVLAKGPGAIESLRMPDWLAPWIPPEFALAVTPMLSALSPAIEAALNQVPTLAGALAVAAWTVWGIGIALIVILGLVCSRLITVLRRRASVFAAPSTGPVAAD